MVVVSKRRAAADSSNHDDIILTNDDSKKIIPSLLDLPFPTQHSPPRNLFRDKFRRLLSLKKYSSSSSFRTLVPSQRNNFIIPRFLASSKSLKDEEDKPLEGIGYNQTEAAYPSQEVPSIEHRTNLWSPKNVDETLIVENGDTLNDYFPIVHSSSQQQNQINNSEIILEDPAIVGYSKFQPDNSNNTQLYPTQTPIVTADNISPTTPFHNYFQFSAEIDSTYHFQHSPSVNMQNLIQDQILLSSSTNSGCGPSLLFTPSPTPLLKNGFAYSLSPESAVDESTLIQQQQQQQHLSKSAATFLPQQPNYYQPNLLPVSCNMAASLNMSQPPNSISSINSTSAANIVGGSPAAATCFGNFLPTNLSTLNALMLSPTTMTASPLISYAFVSQDDLTPSKLTSYSRNMEKLWHGRFNDIFAHFYQNQSHLWELYAADLNQHIDVNMLQNDPSWFSHQDSAKVRFACKDCGHGWTSMKGRIACWINFDPTGSMAQSLCLGPQVHESLHSPQNTSVVPSLTPSTGPVHGIVLFRLFGQQCQKCKYGPFYHAMWYPEEVIKVVDNLFNIINTKYYGAPPMLIYHNRRRTGKPKQQHDTTLCQACAEGICKEPTSTAVMLSSDAHVITNNNSTTNNTTADTVATTSTNNNSNTVMISM